MGNPISTVRKTLKEQNEEDRKDREQQLQILEKMIEGKLENARYQIIGGERGDLMIHGGTIVELHRQINISVTEGGQDIAEAVNSTLDSFFSGDIMGGIKNGLKQIVKVGADAILGNSSAGEYEHEDMFIVWSNNALLRCDAYYYKFNFSSQGVIKATEGATGVLLVKRVLDVSKTNPQVLCWAISSMAARIRESNQATAYIDKAMKIVEKVAQFQRRLRAIEERKVNFDDSRKESESREESDSDNDLLAIGGDFYDDSRKESDSREESDSDRGDSLCESIISESSYDDSREESDPDNDSLAM